MPYLLNTVKGSFAFSHSKSDCEKCFLLGVLKVNKPMGGLHFSQLFHKSFLIPQKEAYLSTRGPQSEARGKGFSLKLHFYGL